VSVIGDHPPRSLQREQVLAGGGQRGRRGHAHGAVVVAGREQLLNAAVPFLEAGMRAGDLVVLSCDEATAALLRAALGPRDALLSEPRISLRGARAPDALGLTRRLLDRAAGSGSGRLRILAIPEFGPDPISWREGQRYESAANTCLCDAPLSALCVYDANVLPAPVVTSACATHPYLLAHGDLVENPEYRPPRRYIAELPVPREPVEDTAPVYVVDAVPTLADLRHQLGAALAQWVSDRDTCEDLHLAASEIAANAFRHGTPPVSARIWAGRGRIVCTITDRGAGLADPVAGFQPAHGEDFSRGGMGLWLARKLWDSVDLLRGPDGFTVRLSSPLR
jgi:anti-sigma regulatory factor (Ser/Thr protein kinase)